MWLNVSLIIEHTKLMNILIMHDEILLQFIIIVGINKNKNLMESKFLTICWHIYSKYSSTLLNLSLTVVFWPSIKLFYFPVIVKIFLQYFRKDWKKNRNKHERHIRNCRRIYTYSMINNHVLFHMVKKNLFFIHFNMISQWL